MALSSLFWGSVDLVEISESPLPPFWGGDFSPPHQSALAETGLSGVLRVGSGFPSDNVLTRAPNGGLRVQREASGSIRGRLRARWGWEARGGAPLGTLASLRHRVSVAPAVAGPLLLESSSLSGFSDACAWLRELVVGGGVADRAPPWVTWVLPAFPSGSGPRSLRPFWVRFGMVGGAPGCCSCRSPGPRPP